jgi:hypothetical protein
MRPQGSFAIADRDWRFHDWGETLANIDLVVLLAYKNGDRQEPSLGFPCCALGFGQRCTDLD